MTFGGCLAATAALANPDALGGFRRRLKPEWIEEALEATGTATLRKRRLPAEQVVWVVLGMALFRDQSIEDVVARLDLALPGKNGAVARSSITQARQRLGSEPMKWLFETTGEKWAERSAGAYKWRGLTVYGMDGTGIRVPDTDENRAHFGGKCSRNGTQSGYPLVRLVVLMALRSHVLRGAGFGPYEATYETEYAYPLLDAVPAHSLTILDRGYFGAPMAVGIERRGSERNWLIRAKSKLKTRVAQRFGRGDELVELDISSHSRGVHPWLPKTWVARAIRYKRKGHPEVVLLTSLRDPKAYPVAEIIALYHERWELELAYDELKTELLEREESIRSKKPDGVAQEIWGILLAYNLIRLEMEQVAREAKVEPIRVAFVPSLVLIRDEWSWLSVASPGAIPARLKKLRANLKRYILPPRRTKRSFPRAVKLKMSNYERKRPRAELAK